VTEALRQFFRNRTEHERIALCAGATVIALAIVYAYVWLPVTRQHDRLLASVPQLRAAAQDMKRDASELARLKTLARKPPPDLKAAIEQTAVANGITLPPGSMGLQGATSARVMIPSAPAAQAFAFIAQLQSAHGLKADRLRMTVLADGRVSLEAIFARAQ